MFSQDSLELPCFALAIQCGTFLQDIVRCFASASETAGETAALLLGDATLFLTAVLLI